VTASERHRSGDVFTYRGLLADPRLLSLTAISAVGTFGSSVVSPALPSLADAFGVSDASVGLAMTAFTVPQIGLILFLGLLADMYGRRVVLLPSLVLFGVTGLAITLADGFSAVVWLRVLQGAVAGGIVPLTITVVGDSWEGAVGAAAQGIRLSANGLASIVVPAVAGLLAGLSWHYPFYLFAMAFPAALLGYRYLPESGRAEAPTAPLAEVKGYVRALRVELTDRDLAIMLLGGLFQGLGWFAVLTFVPLFAVRSLGATAFAAGLALSMRGFVRILLAPFAGLALTVTSRRLALVSALAISAVGAAAIAASPSVWWLWVLVGVYGVGDALFTPIHRDAVTDLASAERRAGVVNGMVVFRQLGASVAPVAFGAVLAVAGFKPVFVLAAGIFAAYAAVVFLFFRG
jgi:MFS family permease